MLNIALHPTRNIVDKALHSTDKLVDEVLHPTRKTADNSLLSHREDGSQLCGVSSTVNKCKFERIEVLQITTIQEINSPTIITNQSFFKKSIWKCLISILDSIRRNGFECIAKHRNCN